MTLFEAPPETQQVELCFLEIYNEEVYDLLSRMKQPSNIRYDHASEVICVLYLPEYKTTSLHNL
jgi:hypothetical protein